MIKRKPGDVDVINRTKINCSPEISRVLCGSWYVNGVHQTIPTNKDDAFIVVSSEDSNPGDDQTALIVHYDFVGWVYLR